MRLSYILPLLLITSILSVEAFSLPIREKPNLIIIITDDQGYGDVGFNGCTDIPTPNIDRIAYEGVKFTEGYVSYPVCGPSRAGLLTGRYQDRFGFTTNPTISPNHPEAGIPLEEKNIAEVLTKVGYKNAIIGKWHMGSHPVHHPLNRGFHHFFGFLSGGHNYFPRQYNLNDLSEVKKPYDWYRTKLIHDRERVDVDADYLTDVLSDTSVDFIKKCSKNNDPFFLYVAYNAPHNPLQATQKYLDRFSHIENWGRRNYAAMVSAVDDGVGQILQTLTECGLDNNTLVFFLSDNGGASNNSSDNGILRDHKGSLFEGGLRVPFALRWSNTIPAGTVYTHPIISLDIMATITTLAGVEISTERPLDGVNLLPFVTNENKEAPHHYIFWRDFIRNGMAVRSGDIKLVDERKRDKLGYAVFNVVEDVSEKINLSEKDLDKNEELLEKHTAWKAQLKPTAFPTLGNHKWWLKETVEE